MFGTRLLMNMACRSMSRPTFKITQSFSSMVPVYTQTSTLIGKAIATPTNLLVRNLRQMIMRAEQDMQMQMDINGLCQLSLLVQVNQTGLIKQSR